MRILSNEISHDKSYLPYACFVYSNMISKNRSCFKTSDMHNAFHASRDHAQNTFIRCAAIIWHFYENARARWPDPVADKRFQSLAVLKNLFIITTSMIMRWRIWTLIYDHCLRSKGFIVLFQFPLL